MGGRGEKGPAEDMICMGWGNLGGVNCPTDGALSRLWRFIGEALGEEGRVIRGSFVEGDVC